jgi:acetyl-CoA C-acetyltransferase
VAEVVIVAATRSPIGRVGKGSIVEMHGYDMAEHMVQAALACVLELPVGRGLRWP